MTFDAIPVPVVVDASAAIEFLTGDDKWASMFATWIRNERPLFAPAHFPAEVANGQLRGRRLDAQTVISALERLSAAGIEAADRGLPGLVEAIGLADQHGLTVYDALYLQLALDLDGDLATLDDDLRKAALAEGLEVVS